MQILTELTAWRKYLAIQLACAMADEESAKGLVEKCRAATQVNNIDIKDVNTKKAMAYEDDDFVESTEQLTEMHSYRKLVEALYGNVDNDSFIVSREITRRGNNHRSER